MCTPGDLQTGTASSSRSTSGHGNCIAGLVDASSASARSDRASLAEVEILMTSGRKRDSSWELEGTAKKEEGT